MKDFDLIVIGGGSGGLAGAFRAASHGARVALLEPGALGGTCVNVGCVPKKAMWLAADLAQRFRQAEALGFEAGRPVLDWPEFIINRQGYIHDIHASYRRRLDEAGIVLVCSRGRLLGQGRVVTEDGLQLQAPHVLLATGGHAVRPDLEGAELGGVSDDFFDWTHAPARVAVVGGGYVAVELAGVLQALGSQVELLVRGGRLLKGFDEELARVLTEDYRQHGIHVRLENEIGRMQALDDGRIQAFDATGTALEPFDKVLFATGRRPNTATLGAEQAGVALRASGHVEVDAYQNTCAMGVYAVGDVSSELALTPVAIAAARRLMDRLFDGKTESRLDYELVPTVVFSHPPLGTVGMTEEQARQRHGDAVKVFRSGFRPMLHALAGSPQRSLFKLVCVGDEETVVGLHLLGEGSDEILQGFAVAIKRGITRRDLEDTVAIHPTSAEEIVLMR